MRLAGKFAIVTGDSEGLGLAMAEALAREGGDLCIVGRNAKKLADAARHLGDSLKLSVSADLATENGIDRRRPYAGGTGKHEFHLLLPQSEVSQTRPMSAYVQAEQHRLPLLKVD